MVSIETISIIVAATGVFLAAVNQILSNRQAVQQRQTQLLMQIYTDWKTKAFQQQYGRVRFYYANPDKLKNYQDWERLMGLEPNQPFWTSLDEEIINIYSDIQSMSEFFEGIAVLVKRGLIDVDVVEDLLANRIIWWWDFFGPISEDARKIVNDQKLHDHTEYLYNIMKQRQQAAMST
jgi:hypothetical protein